jgi:phosphatidylglycerophosphate synthase
MSLAHSLASVEATLTALTVGRLVFVPIIIASFTVSAPLTTAALLLFIAADIYDGVVARRHDADGPARRALDSIVDRLAIDACLVGAWVSGALPLPILCALLARDLYLALLCRRMMAKRRVAIKADWLYRSLNLAVAGWAIVSPFVSADARVGLALALLAFSLLVALDLSRGVHTVLNAPPRLRNTVVDAGWLRGNAAVARPETHQPS